MTTPFIVSLQVGLPRDFPGVGDDPGEGPWSTGSFKDPVEGSVWLGATNLAGDGQADRKNHGGPDKAVCVYPAVHYPRWRRELDRPDFGFGAFGENFTVDGLTESEVAIGDSFAVGGAVVQVSQPRQPCWKLARRWGIPDLAARVEQAGATGWYFRVLREGEVAPGTGLELLDRPYPEWTIARANEVMRRSRTEPVEALALASCPLLSASWRRTLSFRAEQLLADRGE